ncbi:SLC13 family permease [Terribacillus sp. 179-K 1B1 HS]|uniref:SLC13 family permease n=1 Tax=Terribacillus sp. 179-K 1B1 HS TaxID=3142388 RepID=UPI0039A183C2
MEQINQYSRSERKQAKHTAKSSTRIRVICFIHVFFLLLVALVNLNYPAKVSLFAFLSAMTLWIGTKIPAGFVAISLISFIIIMKAGDPELLYHAFSEDVVWLMFGAFIIGEAIKESGLAARFSRAILYQAKSKHSIIRGYTLALGLTALFIPSTSGRAALSVPVINQLARHFPTKEGQFLAILTPVVILMSTSATLIGAGSHIIGVGLLESTTGKSISFIQWLVWGIPFTIVITTVTMYIVRLLLWPKKSNLSDNIQQDGSNKEDIEQQHLSPKEKKTAILIAALIIGWVSENIHGYDTAFVTIIGSLLFMSPRYGIISWQQGIKAVSWNLLLFVAAATALGQILVDTGVIDWMEKEIMHSLHLFTGASDWTNVLILSIVTVTSHLYITSHTTRAIVFIPSLIIFGQAIGGNLDSIVFLSLIGMNYCVTFPVSSKALLLFYEEGGITYDARDLLKISLVLMPIYIFVILLFYFTYWKWTGLSI